MSRAETEVAATPTETSKAAGVSRGRGKHGVAIFAEVFLPHGCVWWCQSEEVAEIVNLHNQFGISQADPGTTSGLSHVSLGNRLALKSFQLPLECLDLSSNLLDVRSRLGKHTGTQGKDCQNKERRGKSHGRSPAKFAGVLHLYAGNIDTNNHPH